MSLYRVTCDNNYKMTSVKILRNGLCSGRPLKIQEMVCVVLAIEHSKKWFV